MQTWFSKSQIFFSLEFFELGPEFFLTLMLCYVMKSRGETNEREIACVFEREKERETERKRERERWERERDMTGDRWYCVCVWSKNKKGERER